MGKNYVKVFVTYKDKHKIIKSDIVTPIQTGRAVANEIFEGMIGDDTGDNISKDNERYCELTAQYWAWKNYEKIGNPDYVGFMHYRRHFILNEPSTLPKDTWLNKMQVYMYDIIDNDYLKMFNDESIKRYCDKYDCIVLKPYDLNNHKPENTIKKQFANIIQQHGRIFDLFVETLREEAPEYVKEINKVEIAHEQYLCNMFIMKKDLFFEYSEFAFKILKKLEQKVDYTNYSEQEMRFLGYVAEFLLTMFIWKLESRKVKIARVKGARVINGDFYYPEQNYKDINTAITAFATNDNFAQLAVTINSIIENINTEKKYDIIILNDNLETEYKNVLNQQYKNIENVSIRYLNVNNYLKYKLQKYTKVNIFDNKLLKLFLSDIFKNYKKVVFVTENLIFNNDVLLLENIDFKNKIIACCKDYSQLISEDNAIEDDVEFKTNVVTSDLLVYNIKNFINNDIFELVVDYLVQNDFNIKIEDFITECIDDSLIEILQHNWNIEPLYLNPLRSKIPLWVKAEYNKAKQNPYVYNYALSKKPWLANDIEFSTIWWQQARKTIFYEKLLAQTTSANNSSNANCLDKKLREEFHNVHFPNINNHFSEIENSVRLMCILNNAFEFWLKIIILKIKLLFSFGKKRKKYKKRYKNIKKLLKSAKKYKKALKKICEG